jgi:hypothetical protein
MKKAKSSTHRTDQSHKLEQMDYRPWKARCAALLERQGIFSGVVRERQWRQLFATGVTAEQAVERAQMHYNNGRGALWGVQVRGVDEIGTSSAPVRFGPNSHREERPWKIKKKAQPRGWARGSSSCAETVPSYLPRGKHRVSCVENSSVV